MKLYVWFLLSLLGFVALIGIPGNILVLIVYAKKTKRNGTRVFILGLAGVDLFICALTTYRFYLWLHEEAFASDLVCRLFSWVGLASEMASAFVTTAVAVDRYLSICRPHLGWMTDRRARIVCAAGIVVSAILTVPTVAVYTTSHHGVQTCEITEADAFKLWVYAALFVMAASFACMMVTALVMYMLIYREVRKRMKIRPSLIKVAAAAEKSTEKEQQPSKHLAGMLSAGDSMIGISLSTQGIGGRRHSIGGAEGISESTLSKFRRNKKRTGSPVGFRRSPEGQPAGRTVNVAAAAASSSEDTASDGPRTKLTAGRLEQSDRTIKKKSKTGKMLLLATVVFVVTWTARFVMWVVSYMFAEKWAYMKEHDEVAFAFLTLLQHLYYTTPAVNPAIYSFVNNKFKEECVKVVRKMNCLRGSNM